MRRGAEGARAFPRTGEEYFFPEGLVGLSFYRRFRLSPFRPADRSRSPFLLLEALEGGLSFVLIEPGLVVPGYRVAPGREKLALIGARSLSETVALAIATLRERPERITVNLAGPLLLNPRSNLGLQLVVDGYPVRHPLL